MEPAHAAQFHGFGHWRIVSHLAATLLLVIARASLADEQTSAPLPAEEAAGTMVVPEGFHVTLFAAEPDIRQPIGFCLDDRGRLWVAEAYSYPDHNSVLPTVAANAVPPSEASDSSPATLNAQPSTLNSQLPRDRILIFEDADHDGRFDHRTVFFEGLNYVTGIEYGFGGAWVMSPPYMLFIPDRDRDDVPDAEPQVLLDGFGNHANSHNLANGFAWGPDGWLYATHGRTNWSTIGKPGTPEAERTRFDGGVWRYHPTRHVWEPYCDGTTNPWGIDWDDWGEAFVSNCVNPHLFHVIPGAHYEPWRDRESSQHAYERIATIADHLHFTSTGDVREGLGSQAEDVAGGGHAHCGTMVYLGDNWPAAYRNGVFLNNIHGKRINHDVLRRSGSGYVASHAPDLMRSRDDWMMGVTLQYGPDGSVFVLDWSDTGECHSVKNTQKQTGRIFRIAYGTPQPQRVDVATLTDSQLVELHLHPNDWFVRHARRVLQERQANGTDLRSSVARLQELLETHPDVTRRLRALWTLHILSALSDDRLTALLGDVDEHVVAWAVTLLCEDGDPPVAAMQRFAQLARPAVGQVSQPAAPSTPLIRLHLASALQRLPLEQRWEIAAALAERVDDAADQNLPYLVWYAVEPLITADVIRFAALAESTQIPLLRRHIARRIASLTGDWPGLDVLIPILPRLPNATAQRDVLTGILQGLEGRRSVPQPAAWRAAYDALTATNDDALHELATRLALIFDDAVALASLQHAAADVQLPVSRRGAALSALIARRVPGLDESLIALTTDPAVRSIAIRGLAEYQHPDTPQVLLRGYASMSPAERQDVVQTLASRPAWATRLLDAVASGTVARSDVTAFTARQLRSLGDENLNRRLTELWGETRETAADRARLIADWRKKLTPTSIAAADSAAGRATYKKLCANCHKLFDDGAAVGPDLTGSQRRNLDYLLENILDPSASVARDFQMEVIQTDAGRVITGLVIAETNAALTVVTVNEKLVVPLAEVELRQTSKTSLMPDGLLQGLTPDQVRSLVRYLSSDQQTPLAASPSEPRP